MINLLPEDTEKQIRAARTNSFLIKCSILLSIALILLILICTSAYSFLNDYSDATKDSLGTLDTPPNPLQKQADIIHKSLADAKIILDQQIPYSDIMINIASVLPADIVLDYLPLDASTFDKPMAVTAHARSTSAVNILKSNLQKSKLLSNSTVESTTPDSSDVSGYPILVNIKMVIKKDAI
jgi:hypothetical protein